MRKRLESAENEVTKMREREKKEGELRKQRMREIGVGTV